MSGAGLTGGDERVPDDIVEALADGFGARGDEASRLAVEVMNRRAADAVAGQDPAPRAEPAAWAVAGHLTWSEQYAEHLAATIEYAVVEPLYRDPAPAPVVPEEMDRANLDLAAALRPDADRHTHAAYLEKTRRRHLAGWRFFLPTGHVL